jgi:hypothetical protein
MKVMYKLAIMLMLLCSTLAVAQYQYDPNDFPAEVVEYVQGDIPPTLVDIFTGTPFTYPTYAFGFEDGTDRRPTYLTTGDPNIGENVDMPVVPVYGAFRWWEIVAIGNGGRLILKFNHHVTDDKNNPYGIDFIIFGNAQQSKTNNFEWKPWSDPNQVTVGSTTYYERGIVSVSQDGQTWHTFTNGPYADDFAPTAGYKWDYANHCWGEELDPTRPVNPSLTTAGMNGKTVAQMIDLYDGAAGGTGFDLKNLADYNSLASDETGCKWIQYVKIDDNPNHPTPTTEIDAVSDVRAPGDLNRDCRVDMKDFAIAARQMDTEAVGQVCNNWLNSQ